MMEIEAQLESIEKKIQNYDEKIESLSSLITTLIHSFQQTQMPNLKSDILSTIQENLQKSDSFPDVEGMKNLFSQTVGELTENQNGLKLKLIDLENITEQINKSITGLSKKIKSTDNSVLSNKLETLEQNIQNISENIISYKSGNIIQSELSNNGSDEKIDKLSQMVCEQHQINNNFQNTIQQQLTSLENNMKEISLSSGIETSHSYANADFIEIKDKFKDLDLSITSVLSAIKIVDKKYSELQGFQGLVDKLSTDVVSPILLASSDIKTFVNSTTDNFAKINDFVQEYDAGAFKLLQEKMGDLCHLTESVNIDVNKLFDLVDEFKTNTDLSNHVISDNMEKIENMLSEYNENLNEITKTTTVDSIKDAVKVLNDEFYNELLDLFNSLSFEEETEDLKDFVESVLSSITVKTDENSEKLNNIMLQFKNLIRKIEGIEKTQNSISDYLKPEETDDLVYSFDDIQSDLAKMRLVLNDISSNVSSAAPVEEIAEKMQDITSQIDNVSQLLSLSHGSDGETEVIKEQIEALNSQVYDISVRTNKLLLSNEDSTLELKNNLEVFKEVYDKINPEKLYELFYELTHYFNDTNDKIVEVIATTKASHTEAVTIKNALVYVGEWLDGATGVLEEIRANSSNNTVADNSDFIGYFANLTNRLEEIKDLSDNILNKKDENIYLALANIINKLDEFQNIISSQSQTTIAENTEDTTDITLEEIKKLNAKANDNVFIISKRLDLLEENTQKRFDAIEEKLDKLLSAKTPARKISDTKMKNIEKKVSEMGELLSQLSEKLLKE